MAGALSGKFKRMAIYDSVYAEASSVGRGAVSNASLKCSTELEYTKQKLYNLVHSKGMARC